MKKIVLALSLCSAIMADPFTAAPGGKARGMAGAFTAVSNTTSAAYYNPAGTASLKNNKNEITFITLGYNQNALESSKFMSDRQVESFTDVMPDIYFDMGMISSKFGFSYMINNMTLVTSEDKFFNSSVGTIGFGYSVNDSLQIGATLIMNSLLAQTASLFHEVDDYSKIDPFIFGFALGAKYEAYSSVEDSLNIAASYRIGAKDESHNTSNYNKFATGIPDKLSLGINYNRYLSGGSLSLDANYDIIYVDGVTSVDDRNIESRFGETTTMSFGADFAMPSFMIRAGYSVSDIARTNGDDWGNEIMSFGVALPVNSNILEASIEKRTYDFKQPEGKEDSILLTVSYHFVITKQ